MGSPRRTTSIFRSEQLLRHPRRPASPSFCSGRVWSLGTVVVEHVCEHVLASFDLRKFLPSIKSCRLSLFICRRVGR